MDPRNLTIFIAFNSTRIPHADLLCLTRSTLWIGLNGYTTVLVEYSNTPITTNGPIRRFEISWGPRGGDGSVHCRSSVWPEKFRSLTEETSIQYTKESVGCALYLKTFYALLDMHCIASTSLANLIQ